jgi:hypothetical protein
MVRYLKDFDSVPTAIYAVVLEGDPTLLLDAEEPWRPPVCLAAWQLYSSDRFAEI